MRLKHLATNILLICAIILPNFALAQGIAVTVDGRSVTFGAVGPRSIQGRVLVPLRGVLEAIGAEVEWDNRTQTVSAYRGDTDIILRVGARFATIKGQRVPVEVPARLIGGTTMVPLRFLGEALGADIRWEDDTQTVLITTATANTRGNDDREPPIDNRAMPVIQAVRTSARGWIAPGTDIRVELSGTRGGTAVFSIAGLVRDIAMREESPGIYIGTWTIPRSESGFDRSELAISGSLTVNGRTRIEPSTDTISIDSMPPVVTSVLPEPNGRESGRRSGVVVTYEDRNGSGIDTDRVRLTVNGVDETRDATITTTSLRWNPRDVDRRSSVDVSVVVSDKAGNTVTKSWSYRVASEGNPIRSISHNANATISPGETLIVRFGAEPGGRASFSIGPIRNIPMTERSRGVYEGEYTIRRDDQLRDDVVIGSVETKDGETFTLQAPGRVSTRSGRPQPDRNDAPRIASPSRNELVNSPIIVRGTATPLSRVNLKVEYHTNVFGVVTLKHDLFSGTLRVDDRGNWRSEEISLRADKDIEYIVTVYGVDKNGEPTTETTTLTLKRR